MLREYETICALTPLSSKFVPENKRKDLWEDLNMKHRPWWTDWEFLHTPVTELSDQKTHGLYTIFMPLYVTRNPYRMYKANLLTYNLNLCK
jgi:hypothetical protein